MRLSQTRCFDLAGVASFVTSHSGAPHNIPRHGGRGVGHSELDLLNRLVPAGQLARLGHSKRSVSLHPDCPRQVPLVRHVTLSPFEVLPSMRLRFSNRLELGLELVIG